MATVKKATKRTKKGATTRTVKCRVCNENGWTVIRGDLRGKNSAVKPIFVAVAEKIPYELLEPVETDIKEQLRAKSIYGVYLAHDSMGVTRYVGRGRVFARLKQHRRAHPSELKYFSFYVIRDKVHEREIETLCIRVAGPQLLFNTQKKREDIRAGAVRDWEAGTLFYQRRYARGMQPTKK